MFGFDVVLSEDNDVGNNACFKQTQPIKDNGRIDTSCHGKVKNVFVRKKISPYYLNVCEIEIYGNGYNQQNLRRVKIFEYISIL